MTIEERKQTPQELYEEMLEKDRRIKAFVAERVVTLEVNGQEYSGTFWTPDLIITGAKSTDGHQVFLQNEPCEIVSTTHQLMILRAPHKRELKEPNPVLVDCPMAEFTPLEICMNPIDGNGFRSCFGDVAENDDIFMPGVTSTKEIGMPVFTRGMKLYGIIVEVHEEWTATCCLPDLPLE
jgi:hypothetical protein